MGVLYICCIMVVTVSMYVHVLFPFQVKFKDIRVQQIYYYIITLGFFFEQVARFSHIRTETGIRKPYT